jgi:repressor LexA
VNAVANRPLTPTQERVYARLLEHQRRTGRLPELSDLARSLGIHYVSLRQHLEALQRKGYLEFESRGRGRSPLLALPAQATGIPVLGDIPAGPFDAAVAHPEAYLPLPGLPDASFALRVRGDSMADLIQPGDVVLLSRRPPSREGEICAVRVGEEDATLKYVRRLPGGRVELRPHNPAYDTLQVPAEEVSLDGVYLGLLRGDAADALLEPA